MAGNNARVNCADSTGAKNMYIISVNGTKGRLNRLPSACSRDVVVATVKKARLDLRKKVMPAFIVRQRKAWRHKDAVFIYFEVMYNPLMVLLHLTFRHCHKLWTGETGMCN
ncbi:hypothetical protein MKW94_007792 [Papaver nudicaule]|uniref:60S ribosomal protein L23 n=1 Tax=Papaver nudicaule TaxID=74823 RepID=A0AA41S3S5_PAPNU|nr:hypothetical protein [Papaver nudicaule]